MDSPSTRTAEIVALRRRVAGGSRDIERVYFPLAERLAEAGERDEAIAVLRAAIQVGTEDGLLLKAIACLRFAQTLAPSDDHALAADEARLRAATDPDLWAAAARRSDERTTMRMMPAIDERYRDATERCTISWCADRGVAEVTIDHPNEVVPTEWIEHAQHMLVVDGCVEAVPCTATITDAQRTSHRLMLTPASPTAAATMRWNVRVREGTGQSNIAALLLDTGSGVSHRLRNVYYDAPTTAPN
ncbi:hypothetical protein HY634_02085 [Candidatus Uhrbacteria bacterium]|nr:hypothetical protein [Candidatus Uhrbacteria bacterium]